MVTGASRGIGKEIARRFADSGARVVVHFHKNSQAAEQTLADLCSNSHLMVSADLADAVAVGNMAEKVLKEMGKIDVLVNNAGIRRDGLTALLKSDDWQKVLDINLTGTFNMSKHVIPFMLKQKYGRIINITSPVSHLGFHGMAVGGKDPIS